MPRQIWNEGRVVGYSAYEVYVKHAMSIDPDHEPATEKEWLASMMAMGSSMLLRIGKTEASYIDVEFPSDSRLCAANNIIASVFTGAGYVGAGVADTEHKWCTKVTDYGPLISNDAVFSPSGNNVPLSTTELSDTHKSYIREYMKIVDGIVLQPGTWTTNSNRPPQKDFTPTLAKVPTLRISFSEPITTPFFLLLTGFTNRSVVAGVTGFFDPQKAGDTGFGSAVNTQSPQDGDFLGPWAFPWAAKVIFSIPSAYINYFIANKFTRELPTGDDVVTVKSDPIIDIPDAKDDSGLSNLHQYYGALSKWSTRGKIHELNISGDTGSVLSIYQREPMLPPALHGSKVFKLGVYDAFPIDVISPGTVKLYNDTYKYGNSQYTGDYLADSLETYVHQNYAFIRDTSTDTKHSAPVISAKPNVILPNGESGTYQLHQLCPTNSGGLAKIPVASVGFNESLDKPVRCRITTGLSSVTSLSMCDANGDNYNTAGNAGVITIPIKYIGTSDYTSQYESDSINWSNTLIDMLHNNKSAKLTLAISSANPDTANTYDISRLFDDTPVSAMFTHGTTVRQAKLKVPVAGNTWSNLGDEYDGYLRVLLKIYTTEIGTISKFTLTFYALLKDDLTVTRGSSDTDGVYQTSGFYWRGQFDDAIRCWGTSKEPVYPIFGTTIPGTLSTASTAVLRTYKYSNEEAPEELLNTFDGKYNGFTSWQPNVRVVAGNVQGGDVISIIDQSIVLDTLSKCMSNNAGGPNSSATFTFKSSNGCTLLPNNGYGSPLTKAEVDEIYTMCTVGRDVHGTYVVM